MAAEKPFVNQALTYPAVNWRRFFAELFAEGVFGGLVVSQRAAGPNFTVDVSAGRAVITGDNTANQGVYFCQTLAVENVVVTAAPGANSRIDRVIMRVNDPSAGGAAGNNCVIEVLAGVVSTTPVAPALPATAISLATILVAAGTPSITNALITDARVLATLANDVIDDGQATRLGTASPDANSLMRRGAAGTASVTAPTAALHIANKAYVDGFVAQTANIANGAVTNPKFADATGGKVGDIEYRRIANMVFVWGKATDVSPVTLPVGFRPATAWNVGATNEGLVSGATSGVITIHDALGGSGAFSAHFVVAPGT